MSEEHKEELDLKSEKMKLWLEDKSAKLVYALVIGIIACSLYYMVSDLTRVERVNQISIKVESVDSTNLQHVYQQEGLDSLICAVRGYESRLNEKYQYLLEQREGDDRFKTWGAIIVGVVVSVCSFWGYRSLKDLRADVKKQTEQDTIMKVNEYLNNNLPTLVNQNLTNSLRSDITDIIKKHVIDTLNSSEDNTITTRVQSVMDSEKFDKMLEECVRQKVIEVINDMTLNQGHPMTSHDATSSSEDSNVQLT